MTKYEEGKEELAETEPKRETVVIAEQVVEFLRGKGLTIGKARRALEIASDLFDEIAF